MSQSPDTGATPQPPREIPAGWYPDPEGKPQSRYWDGDAWTDQVGPALPQAAQPVQPVQPVIQRVEVDADGRPVSDRSRLAATLLCFFLGVFGVHRFYVGKVGTGVLQVVTFGGLGIWALVDLVLIIVGAFRDKQERLLVNW
ncbi:NINE protein [Intrasporangium flavum]|uniref:NINE protein n=1 Tax=Intrasporangium flavum TaxID=1428657 RepID=UPI0009F8BBDE|nr:NINE protein [Intrasporangium flavum]